MDTFAAKYQAKYSKAVTCLTKDRAVLLAFYDFPAEPWQHIRTTNPIESVFATVRHRTVRSKGCLSHRTALAMVFQPVTAASKTWRRLNGLRKVALCHPGRPIHRRHPGRQNRNPRRRLIMPSPTFGHSSMTRDTPLIMNSWRVPFAVCCLFLTVPLLAVAQDGGVSGTVTDIAGGALPGVTVEVSGATLTSPQVAVTDGAGASRSRGYPRHLPRQFHPGRFRAAGAAGGADRRGHRYRGRRPAARRALRGSHRVGDRDRHRRARHQHAPRGDRSQSRDAGAAGKHAARRSLP